MDPLVFKAGPVLMTVIYSVVGILVFVLGFLFIDRLTPYRLWDEIVKEKNLALAIILAGFQIALGLIIAAALHG